MDVFPLDPIYTKILTRSVAPINDPYEHGIYRATSDDGLSWTHEGKLLIAHASIPAAFTDRSGRVWVYFEDFRNIKTEVESVSFAWEQDNYDLAQPRPVVFDPSLDSSVKVLDPEPVLLPN